jgi:hypothetical protein
MAKFDVKAIAAMKEVFEKAQYVKREWKTDESCTMTLSEYAELIDPAFKYVEGNPVVIAKERKDGGIFTKMAIQLKGGSMIEYDLSYENDFEEGDEIQLDTLTFCIEKCLDKSHGYATGEIVA